MGGKAAGTLLLLRELSEGSSGLTQGYGCYAYFDHLTRELQQQLRRMEAQALELAANLQTCAHVMQHTTDSQRMENRA